MKMMRMRMTKVSAIALTTFGLIAGSAFTSELDNHLQQNQLSTFCGLITGRLADAIVTFNATIKFVLEAQAAGEFNMALGGSAKATLILRDHILPSYEAHIGICNSSNNSNNSNNGEK